MGRPIFLFALLALAACSNTEPPQEQQATSSTALQCGKDKDCKGDRICNAGQCSSPKPDSLTSSTTPISGVQSTETRVDSTSDPIPVCKAGDNRTKIPVWEPSFDSDGLLTSNPPQKNGQVVFIQFDTDREEVLTLCTNNDSLYSFSQTPADADPGGLWVNIRGNAQFSQGTCYFKGYYVNEEVLGIHGGWTETYFAAFDKERLIMSNKYCLAKAIE